MNKKSYNLLMMPLIASFMFSCSNSEFENEASTKISVSMQDFVTESTTTRVAVEVDQTDKISIKWTAGDMLGIFPDEGDQVSFRLSESSITNEGKTALFDGGAWALKSGHEYYAYTPFNRSNYSESTNISALPVSYLGQNSSSFGDTQHISSYDYQVAGATSSNTGNLTFAFKRIGALLRLKFTLPEDGEYKKLILITESEDDVFPVEGTVNLKGTNIQEYTPTKYESSLEINLNEVAGKKGDIVYVYMMVPQMQLKAAGLTLKAKLTYNGKYTVYDICKAGTEGTPDAFNAGTTYKRDAVIMSSSEEGNDDEEEDDPTKDPINHGYPPIE